MDREVPGMKLLFEMEQRRKAIPDADNGNDSDNDEDDELENESGESEDEEGKEEKGSKCAKTILWHIESEVQKRKAECAKQLAESPKACRRSKFELQSQGPLSRSHLDPEHERLWKLMDSYLHCDVHSIQRQLLNHVEYTLGHSRFNFDKSCCYKAAALSVRDRLMESSHDTKQHYLMRATKHVYYLSLEFSLGRLLQHSLLNLGLETEYTKALDELGYKLEDLYDNENDFDFDSGLGAEQGNEDRGGLAGCLLESLATLGIPASGYGLRYGCQSVQQRLRDGRWVEVPNHDLGGLRKVWEVERYDVQISVKFHGKVERYTDHEIERRRWVDTEPVLATAYDVPISGYNTFNTNNLRVCRPAFHSFSLALFLSIYCVVAIVTPLELKKR